jgi:hypothetical protein
MENLFHFKFFSTPKFMVENSFHLPTKLHSANTIRIIGSILKELSKHHQTIKKKPQKKTQIGKAKEYSIER